MQETDWVVCVESTLYEKGSRYIQTPASWSSANYWPENVKTYGSRKAALEGVPDSLGNGYILAIMQVSEAKPWMTRKKDEEQEQLAELEKLIAERSTIAAQKAVSARDEWFAEEVLNYHSGCEEGKREFLAHIGFDQYAEEEFRLDVSVEVTATRERAEDIASEIRSLINDRTEAYCSYVEVEPS